MPQVEENGYDSCQIGMEVVEMVREIVRQAGGQTARLSSA